MSNDKRLGVNPLEWVDPNSKPTPGTAPAPGKGDAPAPSGAAASLGGGIFLPAETMTKEDIVNKGKIKIKQTMDTSEALAHMQDLIQSLESGIIRAEDGDNKLVLGVADTMQFEMKLSRKKDKAKCSIEMEWCEDETKIDGFKIKNEA